MKPITRNLLFLVFLALIAGAYQVSASGLGVGDIQDEATQQAISENCPEYYQTRDGACLRRTFRSYFLFRGIRGGGPGSGK